MKKFLILLLLSVILMGLTGCSKDPLLGSWTGEMVMDLSDELAGLSDLGLSSETEVIDRLPVSVTFVFNSDGTYTVSLDTAKFKGAFDEWVNGLKTVVVDAMYAQMEATAGMDRDSVNVLFQGEYGMTLEEYFISEFDSVFDSNYEELLDGLIADSAQEPQKYTAADSKIMFEDEEEDFSFVYSIEGDTMTVTECDLDNLILPFTLIKGK